MKGKVIAGIVTSLLLGQLLAGCGNRNSGGGAATAGPRGLAGRDITAMAVEGSDGPAAFDAQSNHSFTNVFGGTSGAAVMQYFNDRIHYLISDSDPIGVDIEPHPFTYKDWLKDNSLSPIGSFFDFEPQTTGMQQAEVGAANVGMELWLQSLVNHVSVTLEIGGQPVPINSGRVGIMIFGPGYKEFETDSQGRTLAIPTEYRQAVLVHEARHSDCTGGITDSALDAARTARSYRDFTGTFSRMTCGHLHVYCPTGDYAGLPACDITPWGAYSVSAVYAAGMIGNLQGVNREFMQIVTADYFSRLLFDAQGMLNGAYGKPDMSTSGLQPE